MPPILIDTNVLVYAHDRHEYTKQAQALHVLDRLHVDSAGRLSVQCLAEFFRATTRGAEPLLTVEEAARQVDRFARMACVRHYTADRA